jgi:hypothetical protein
MKGVARKNGLVAKVARIVRESPMVDQTGVEP